MPSHIYIHKLTRSSAQELRYRLPDLDSVTVNLPAGLYTTFRTYGGRTRVIGLRAHLDRLYLPAKSRGVKVVQDQNLLRETLSALLRRVSPHEARVRLILDMSDEKGTLYVLMQVLQELPVSVFEEGVRADLSRVSREKPALKQTAFISQSSAERRRVKGDVFEVLLTHRSRILEGMTSNFFHVREGVMSTAGRGVLAGVTRRTVIDLAKDAGIPVRYRALPVREISEITEAFITSSSRGVVPVAEIAGTMVADGRVGPITKQLIGLYEEKMLSIAESIL